MKRKESRLTLGILINNLDTEFQQEIWNGAEAAAKKQNCNIMFLGGGAPNSPYDNSEQYAKLYDYISSETVDGLISISGTIGGYIGLEALIQKIKKLMGNVPILNYGPSFPGIPSAVFDNTSGIQSMVEHLVTVHQRKKLVLMGALDTSVDGSERKAGFLRALKKYNLKPAQEGLLIGEYRYGLAYKNLSEWLKKGYDFDGVVASSDSMAFACYHALRDRGIKVPEEVSITGVDDFLSARYFDVPLTTIRQPVHEIAFWAVESLVKMISEKQIVQDKLFESKAVIRQSCGCFSQSTMLSRTDISKKRLLNELHFIDKKVQQDLIELYHSLLEGKTEEEFFLRHFQSIIRKKSIHSEINTSWEIIISLFRKILYESSSRSDLNKQEEILHKLRTMVKEKAEQVHAVNLLKFRLQMVNVQYASAGTVSSFSLERFVQGLPINLKMLNINNCFISLLEPGTRESQSRLIFGFYQNKELEIPSSGVLFLTSKLFPRDLVPSGQRFNYYVETLFHEKKQIGLIVLGLDPGNGILITALNSIIRSSIRSSMLVDEMRKKDQELENVVSLLENRAVELESANKQIKRDQNQLLASEKMASLGRLTAGIAHEMNTPLAAIRASINELKSLVHEYKSSIIDPDVSTEDHKEIAEEMRKALQLADKAGNKASSFIRSIKTQTRNDQSSDPSVQFSLKQVIEECITLLGHRLRYEKCIVKTQWDEEDLNLCGKPGKLSQVITNLLVNSIEAMAPDGGNILISVKEGPSKVKITLCDNGPGIPSDISDKIFDPLFTTKPFGIGTGLGLTICHDIIKGDFKGNIKAKSKPDGGTCFTLSLPRTQEDCNG